MTHNSSACPRKRTVTIHVCMHHSHFPLGPSLPGIDSIGGVRIPCAYCGVLAFRPSHAVVSSSGVIPVAPSLDTTGWFARDPSVLHRVGHLLLRLPYAGIRQPRIIYIADDCFELSKIPARRLTQVVKKSVEKLFGRQVRHVNLENYLSSRISGLSNYSNGHKNGDSKFPLLALCNAMRSLHKREFKDQHMEWINSVKPAVDARIVSDLSEDGDSDIDDCQDVRKEARSALSELLKDDGILVIPTALGCPPKLNAKQLSSEIYNSQTLRLLSLASMSGCCQVSIPLGTHDKCPISVSFIARHGGDRFLLDTQTMYTTIQEQGEILAKSSVSSKQAMNEEAAEAAKDKTIKQCSLRRTLWHQQKIIFLIAHPMYQSTTCPPVPTLFGILISHIPCNYGQSNIAIS
eukprot:XP_023155876.1 outer envelope protein 64, chloroplastic isoform X1 [Zea mays]